MELSCERGLVAVRARDCAFNLSAQNENVRPQALRVIGIPRQARIGEDGNNNQNGRSGC